MQGTLLPERAPLHCYVYLMMAGSTINRRSRDRLHLFLLLYLHLHRCLCPTTNFEYRPIYALELISLLAPLAERYMPFGMMHVMDTPMCYFLVHQMACSGLIQSALRLHLQERKISFRLLPSHHSLARLGLSITPTGSMDFCWMFLLQSRLMEELPSPIAD